MTTRVWSALLIGSAVVTGASLDLRTKARAAAHKPCAVTTVAALGGTRPFVDAKSGIALNYPTAWHNQPAKTAELAVACPACDAALQLDVPAMGWHPPFIPVGLVTTRYVDALRQSDVPDAAVQETADVQVSGATARRVTCRGHDRKGCPCIDTALVIVHSGQVYILSCDSDDAGAPTARRALDAAAASVRWTK
jgi:hypothetical protein